MSTKKEIAKLLEENRDELDRQNQIIRALGVDAFGAKMINKRRIKVERKDGSVEELDHAEVLKRLATREGLAARVREASGRCLDCGKRLCRTWKTSNVVRCSNCRLSKVRKPKPLCIDCGAELHKMARSLGRKRCVKCAALARRVKKKTCLDCGRELSVTNGVKKIHRCWDCSVKRKKKPVSWSALSKLVGVSAGALSAWKTGKKKPTADNLIKLQAAAKELGIELPEHLSQ